MSGRCANAICLGQISQKTVKCNAVYTIQANLSVHAVNDLHSGGPLIVDADNGQKVAQYMQDALGSAPVTSAGRDWRPVLSEAFVRRLYALEAAELLPAVVLHEQRQRLLPPPSTPVLQPAILPGLWIEPDSPPRKRKWTGILLTSNYRKGLHPSRREPSTSDKSSARHLCTSRIEALVHGGLQGVQEGMPQPRWLPMA